MQFGAKSEHLREEQLQLGKEALEQAIAKEDAQADRQDPQLRARTTPPGDVPAEAHCRHICCGSR